MHVELWVWAATLAAVVALLAVDLIVGRRAHTPSLREAAAWVVFYAVLAVAFGLGVLTLAGARYGGEFFAGWVTEYTLSVDNLVVFVIILRRFAVPAAYQQRVLTVGIVLALAMRAVFIALGAAAIARFSWVFYLFGAFLIYTAWKVARHRDDENAQLGDMLVLRVVRRVLPTTTRYDGSRLVTREGGRRLVTPMLVVMITVGVTDALFAVDSIPAIFGLTKEPFLVFTANAFALLGLRQLYFLLGGLLDRLVYLSYGLAVVLAFIGVKLVLEALHSNTLPFVAGGEPVRGVPQIPVTVSLPVVVGTLAVTVVASLVADRRARRRGPEVPAPDSSGAARTDVAGSGSGAPD